MQSLKALFNVKDAVKTGGYILWVAECTFGIQPEFIDWCSMASRAELDQAVRTRYDLKGHNSLMLRKLLDDVNVALLSQLAPDVVASLGLHLFLPCRTESSGFDGVWVPISDTRLHPSRT